MNHSISVVQIQWFDLLIWFLRSCTNLTIQVFEYPDQSSIYCPILWIWTFSCTKIHIINWESLSFGSISTYMYLLSLMLRRNFWSSWSAFSLTKFSSRRFCCDKFIWLWKSSFLVIIFQAGICLWPPTSVVALIRAFKKIPTWWVPIANGPLVSV